MTDSGDARVAVYIDFDNIVISRYDQVHGRHQFQRDRSRDADGTEFGDRLAEAAVDVGAVIDFASSYGTLVLTRAYADWSARVNAEYRGQLVGRAVDLVQLFPAAAYGKNGADIRLAVDTVEDMFRLPDLTHVVIVAGDSDYIALAQRCKRLGRYVVGIGVAGSTSRSLAAACDELVTYDSLPGVTAAASAETSDGAGGSARRSRRRRQGRRDDTAGGARTDGSDESASTDDADEASTATAVDDPVHDPGESEDDQVRATQLFERALRIGHQRDDEDWLHSSSVKLQMKRMDPSFSEKALGYRSFSEFVKSRDDVADLDDSTNTQLVRLHEH
ncbi:NYN domain-containing protein [Solicola gregarius]|uniref:NYN domain-containing protein n=1 Tax=Solicola gregarius TaxID=2908642 RepID=A0AA46TKN0_9ACTN|nr:NYN domain-containing protein [Solicola gregarius]UYM06664.1 NYN domain-containing protein [Solicola gregarius]